MTYIGVTQQVKIVQNVHGCPWPSQPTFVCISQPLGTFSHYKM